MTLVVREEALRERSFLCILKRAKVVIGASMIEKEQRTDNMVARLIFILGQA